MFQEALDNYTSNEVTLKQLRRYITEYFSDEVLSTLTIERNCLIDRFGQRLTAFIDLPMEPLKTVSTTARFTVPLTWLDHFRNQHFPRFLSNRWPINFKTIEIPVEIEVGAVYPKLPQILPRYGGTMRFASLPRVTAYSEQGRPPFDQA